MKNYVIRQIQKLIKHELISGSFFIFLGTTFASILSFLLNLFLVRHFNANNYATYASLIYAITLVSVPIQSFQTILVRFAADFFLQKKLAEAASLYKKATLSAVAIGSSIFLITLFSANQIAGFLHIQPVSLVMLAGLCVVVGYVGVVNISFIQSLLKFRFLAFLTIFSTCIKVFVGMLFVLLGWSVGGVLFALILAFFIPILFGLIPLRSYVMHGEKNITLPRKEIMHYALPAAIAVTSLWSFTSMDIILVKHFFSSSLADLYAGIGLAARAIFYFTMPIPLVMFPLIIKNKNAGKPINGLLYASLLLVGLSSFAVTAFYFLFPTFSIQFFLGGGRYLNGISYLGIAGVYLSLFSLVNVLVNFFLSLQKMKVAYFVSTAAVAQIVCITYFHNNLYQIITISSVLVLVLLLILLLYYLRLYGKRQNT